MSRLDTERIERAKRNRRNQLIEWEKYDNSHIQTPHIKENSKKMKGVIFKPNIVFLEAAARDDIGEVSRLLADNISPDVKNEDGLTALHQCCIDNSITMCTLLLDNGANVNAVDNELWTPLHAAATCGHRDLCKFLITRGADLLAINIDGNMPYDMCDDDNTLILVESEMAAQNVTQQQIDEIRQGPERLMLMDMQKLTFSGVDLNDLDNQGAAPLHIACACGYVDVARYLLGNGVNCELPDIEGWLPIHIAVCWSQIDIVELLVAYGANMLSTTKSGQTVFSISDSTELHQRLNEIWDQREQLKMSSKENEFESHSNRCSLRRKASSVSRCSTRQKRDKKLCEALQEKQMGEKVEAEILEFQMISSDDIAINPPPNISFSPKMESGSSTHLQREEKKKMRDSRQIENEEIKKEIKEPPKYSVTQESISQPETIISSVPLPPPRAKKSRQNGNLEANPSQLDSTNSVNSSESFKVRNNTRVPRTVPPPRIRSPEIGLPIKPARSATQNVNDLNIHKDSIGDGSIIMAQDKRRKNSHGTPPLNPLRTDATPVLRRNYSSEQYLDGSKSNSYKSEQKKTPESFVCCKLM